MVKQHELTRLNELINRSAIYETFEVLQQSFDKYNRLENRSNYRYEISTNIYEINQEIEHLKTLLKDLAKEAQKWEAFE